MNKNELEAIMKRFGDTQETLADALGISRVCLNSKINERNNASFTQPEIQRIKARYDLTCTQLEEIFFNQNVSNQDTN